MDGPLGPFVARYYAPLGTWLYTAYAKGLELLPEDVVLDVACGSGAFLARHAKHVRCIARLDQSRAMIDQATWEVEPTDADATRQPGGIDPAAGAAVLDASAAMPSASTQG